MIRARAWPLVALLALAASGCRGSRKSASSTPDAASVTATTKARGADSVFTRIAREAADEALAATRRLREGSAERCGEGADYTALRRAIARGKGLWRITAGGGTEVLLGPRRSTNEAGGALARLDAALAARDCGRAGGELKSVERSLTLVQIELEAGLPEREVARSLSEAAYELGAVITESSQEIPVDEAGVLADAAGLLDGIERVATAFERAGDAGVGPPARWRAPHAELAHAVESARTAGLTGLVGRARLAVETGELGAALRMLLRDRGLPSSPPYVPRRRVAPTLDEEPVSVLTVPAPKSPLVPAQVELGRRLFFDARLSSGGQRSCATCHQPQRAFTDGLRAPASLDPATPLTRGTPTLLYSAVQAAFLWDGRLATAPTQALRVLASKAEMGITPEELERRVADDPTYAKGFAAAFPDGVRAANVARALGAFQDAELVTASAPIDRFARGEAAALDASSLAGFDVFAGAGRCARCHVPPLFGGTRPTDFAVAVYAALGTPTRASGGRLDADRGRADVTGDAADEGAFKTPTLREIARTAPYFHNGVFPTLESVIDFYDKGGGAGLGLRVPNQDPDVRPLELGAERRKHLLAFLRRALGDAPGGR